MRHTASSVLSALSALAVALFLTACGGGNSDTTPRVGITSVQVMGDSLADVGTFGYKFTVQGAASLIYPERVAQSYGINSLCPFFKATSPTTFVINPAPGCTDFAIGGGRINNPSAPASPVSIIQQLQSAAALRNFSVSDLVIIDGGSNDAADLVGAYLKVPSDHAASYAALLGTQLSPGVVATNLGAGASGLATAGALYMTALADTFHSSIQANVLDKGATHVALLNVPGITGTPRFQMVLDGIAAASGGGAAGATARASAEGLFDSWVQAFNTELAAKFAGNPNVVVVDFYSAFKDQIAHPAQFDLTNVTVPVCPVTGQDASGLPAFDFPTCTDAALSAAPPAGAVGPDWWKRYGFSDSFHPTPYGHQLIAELIAKSLAIAGWL